MSTSSLVRAGVPQGSVLGPLLFTMYILDFKQVLNVCKYNLYADDLQIYFPCKPVDIKEAILAVNRDIEAVLEWSTRNKLILNYDKTQTIIFGTSRNVRALDLLSIPKIMVGATAISYSLSVKYLGVKIASNLAWESQVTIITKKVRSALYRLKLSKDLFPTALRKRLVTTLIQPHIDYCCVAFTDITHEQNLRLYRAMNACLRFIFNIRTDVHISPYYKKLGMLKVDARRSYFTGCQLFAILKTGQPHLLFDKFTQRSNLLKRTTRAPYDALVLPNCRTELFKRSFRLSATRLWNDLPSCIRDSRTLNGFKQKLYDYLLTTSST